LLCPHTSVGLEAIERYRQESGDPTPTVLLATAHPAKFPEVVQRTLGLTAPSDPALAQLWQQPVSVTPLEADPAALRTVLRDLAAR
jgi:threonine synthase